MILRTFYDRLINIKNIFRKKDVQENIIIEDTINPEPASPDIIPEKQIIKKKTYIPEKTGYRNVTINMNIENCNEQTEKADKTKKNYRNIK